MRPTTASINSVSGARLYRSVTEDVYQYPNEQDAASAFTSLIQSASACSGTTTRRRDEGGYTEQVSLATGSVNGAPAGAIWTQQQMRYLQAPATSPQGAPGNPLQSIHPGRQRHHRHEVLHQWRVLAPRGPGIRGAAPCAVQCGTLDDAVKARA
jgi:hypothetical protein